MSPLVSKALLAELHLSMWAEAVSGHPEPSSHAKVFGPLPHAVKKRMFVVKRGGISHPEEHGKRVKWAS